MTVLEAAGGVCEDNTAGATGGAGAQGIVAVFLTGLELTFFVFISRAFSNFLSKLLLE